MKFILYSFSAAVFIYISYNYGYNEGAIETGAKCGAQINELTEKFGKLIDPKQYYNQVVDLCITKCMWQNSGIGTLKGPIIIDSASEEYNCVCEDHGWQR